MYMYIIYFYMFTGYIYNTIYNQNGLRYSSTTLIFGGEYGDLVYIFIILCVSDIYILVFIIIYYNIYLVTFGVSKIIEYVSFGFVWCDECWICLGRRALVRVDISRCLFGFLNKNRKKINFMCTGKWNKYFHFVDKIRVNILVMLKYFSSFNSVQCASLDVIASLFFFLS